MARPHVARPVAGTSAPSHTLATVAEGGMATAGTSRRRCPWPSALALSAPGRLGMNLVLLSRPAKPAANKIGRGTLMNQSSGRWESVNRDVLTRLKTSGGVGGSTHYIVNICAYPIPDNQYN